MGNIARNSIDAGECIIILDYIEYLKELDEWSKGTKDNPTQIIGIHASYITGVIDRV